MSELAPVTRESVVPSDDDLLFTRQKLLGIAEGILALLRSRPGVPRPFEIQLNELLEAVVHDAGDDWLLPQSYLQLALLSDLELEFDALSEEQDGSENFINLSKLAELIDRLAQVLTVVAGGARPILIDSAQEILDELDNAKKEVEASELVLTVAQMVSKAATELGSREKAETWLVSPNDAIDGASPISLLSDSEGARIVQGLLNGGNRLPKGSV